MATVEQRQKSKVHTVYKLQNGTRVPSVTTVLGILNKPALIDWAYRCGCDGIDYKAVRDTSADIGTLAHYLFACELVGELPDTSEYSKADIFMAVGMLGRFREWAKAHTLETVFVERPFVSEIHTYGSTIDWYGLLDDKATLLDFKTSNGIYPEYYYQLAAYGQVLLEQGYEIEEYRILRIGRDEDGFEEVVRTELEGEWLVFYNCKAIYNLQKELRRGK